MNVSPINEDYDDDARRLQAICAAAYREHRWRVYTTHDMLHSPSLRAMAGPGLDVLIIRLDVSRGGVDWAVQQGVSRYLLRDYAASIREVVADAMIDQANRGIAEQLDSA